MNRRHYLKVGTLASLAMIGRPVLASVEDKAAEAQKPSDPRTWKIGGFNRAWAAWDLDEALKGVREAGFSTLGLIAPQKGENLIGSEMSPKAIETTKRKIQDAGLDLVVAAVRFREDDTLQKLKDDLLHQLENTAKLGARFLMTFGVDRPEHFAKFEKVMTDIAARAEKAKVGLVIKPHGGITLGPTEILRCLEHVNHPNFSVWYDPGNLIHYTGGDPIEAYTPLARHITGFCAKDCARKGGDVMMPFGDGRVDFPAMFSKMQATGFNGPIFIEGIRIGKTAEETAAHAKANRLVLEQAIAKIVKS